MRSREPARFSRSPERSRGGLTRVERESAFRLLICEIVFARLAELVSRTVHHLTRDAGILDHSVAVREAPPLLLLVFCSKDKLLCRLKQVLEIFRDRLASGTSRE